MIYAVIKTGGKQYQVTSQQEVLVDKLVGAVGDTISFDQILLAVNDSQVKIGTPILKGTKVTAQILKQVKAPKIRVATYRAKSRYRRVKGHRQPLTLVKIVSIVDREKKVKRGSH